VVEPILGSGGDPSITWMIIKSSNFILFLKIIYIYTLSNAYVDPLFTWLMF